MNLKISQQYHANTIMEKRINEKIGAWCNTFKDEIKSILQSPSHKSLTSEELSQHIMQMLMSYQPLHLEKEDFQKRKRVKNVVPYFDRCCAKRANGEQCTRRKKDGESFCGTHTKGTPHGTIQSSQEPTQTVEKVNAWAQDFNGIVYYIDDNGNVYNPEDIYQNKTNPQIIAKYVKDEDGKYSIPTLFNGEI